MGENKRVLIVTYYWPPSAGSGVQRWLKFAKYLPENGWDPVIFTPENPDFDLKDEGLLGAVSPGTEVLRFPIWEPYGVLRKLKKKPLKDPAVILERKKKSLLDKTAIWMRANLTVPDPRVFWVRSSVRFLLGIIESNHIEAVITTGPPHSMHLIGRNLKRKKNLAWIADFRDPWTSWEFLDAMPMLGMIRRLHLKLEQSVLREADGVVTISPTFARELEEIGGRKVEIITNGFDTADLPAGFAAPVPPTGVFHVVYTGIIDSIRDPVPFLKAFKLAFGEASVKVLLTFVGKVSEPVRNFIKEDDWLATHVAFAGYLPHREVFEFYQNADLLLLILTHTKNAQGNIPGKLFEYIATGKKIIALGDPEGDSARIIRELDAGGVFRHGAVDEMRQFLLRHSGNPDRGIPRGNMGKYDRKHLTRQLAGLLNEKTDTLS